MEHEMMIVFISGNTQMVEELKHSPHVEHVGRVFVPRAGNAATDDLPWCADNGAFTGFDEKLFLRMLLKLKGVQGCKFVAAPDVVCNWSETSDLFERWGPEIRSYGFPVAYVAQDGLCPYQIPAHCDAVFIGGSTDWKLSSDAVAVAHRAKEMGKWLHVGRVNTERRIKRVRAMHADSIDGTRFSRFRKDVPKLLSRVAAESRQRVMQ